MGSDSIEQYDVIASSRRSNPDPIWIASPAARNAVSILRTVQQTLLFLSIGLWCSSAMAFSCTRYTEMFDTLKKAPVAPVEVRADWVSRQFLGIPYHLFAWGEGAQGRFDQQPLYCFDYIDCETFVTAVLALVWSHDRHEYEQTLRRFRYLGGQVDFLTRRHFTSVDWNPLLERLGVLKDITPTFKGTQVSEADIDKAAWYRQLPLTTIRLQEQTLAPQRLAELKKRGQQHPIQHSSLSYLPWTTLFNKAGKPNLAVFNQIPQGAVIQIVRPHWPDKTKYGTYLEISHLGFVFRHDNVVWFRHASSVAHRVIEQPLIPYLQEARKVPSIAGIHVAALGHKVS